MTNEVVHFEVNGPDIDALAKFYGELFGWHVQQSPEFGPYGLIDTHAGSGINGGFGQSQDGGTNVIFYVAVDDLQATLDTAEKLGGKTVVPVTKMEMVTFAWFSDLEGNNIGLVTAAQPGQEAPGVSAGSNPPVDWFEVLVADPEKAWTFYSKLFGWEIEKSEGEGYVYGQVKAGIGGGIGSSMDGKPRVTLYAGTNEMQKYLDRAVELGGTIAMPVMQVQEGLSVCQFIDPQGTFFGMYSQV